MLYKSQKRSFQGGDLTEGEDQSMENAFVVPFLLGGLDGRMPVKVRFLKLFKLDLYPNEINYYASVLAGSTRPTNH